MKILTTISYYTPYISGLTLHAKRLSEALVKRGFTVTVLTNQHVDNLFSFETMEGVSVVRAKPLLKLSKGFLSLDWVVKSFQLARQIDVVHINLPQFEGVVPAVFGKLFGKKVLVTYHCEVILPSGLSNRIIETLLALSNLATLILADSIVTYTKDFVFHSKMLHHFPKKISYIYPPIPIPKIDKRVQSVIRRKITRPEILLKPGLKIMRRYGKGRALSNSRALIIGVAARLSAEKGIEYLLEAIPLLEDKFKIQNSSRSNRDKITTQNFKVNSAINTPRERPEALIHLGSDRLQRSGSHDSPEVEGSVKIVIAGSLNPVGEKAYKEKILKLVEKYKDHIVFLGELAEEEMGSFYSLLDVLVLPSINSTEAFGMVQVEAMFSGVPVVSSDLPGVRVPIRRTGMGVIASTQDSSQLARAITTIVKNKKHYIKPKSDIEQEFSLKKTVMLYSNILTKSL